MVNLFIFATTADRVLYAQKWKEGKVPIKEEWVLKLIGYVEMARLMVKIKDQNEEKYMKEWKFLSGEKYSSQM